MSSQETRASSAAVLGAVQTLGIDRVTAEVVRALRHAQIPSLLLKGPALVRTLYEGGTSRTYLDCDLLVRHSDVPAAERILMDLGFVHPRIEEQEWAAFLLHAHSWTRPADNKWVDLHWTLTHAGASPERLWEVLRREIASLRLCGVHVDIPCDAALAVVVALHAAASGPDVGQPLEDLRRALERFDWETWNAGARIADELDATAAFAAGLRMIERGAALADELDLPRDTSFELWLTTRSTWPRGWSGAARIERLVRAAGPWRRLRVAAAVAFPSPSEMRRWKPLAARGRVGLAAAYAWRPLELAVRLGPALAARREARRKGTVGG